MLLQQVGADDGAVVVADHRDDGKTAAQLVERRVHRAGHRAVRPEAQPGRMHLGQHTLAVRREVLGLFEVHRRERRLRVGLHDHHRERHAGGLAFHHVVFADDVVRQPLPALVRTFPGVDVERLVRLAVVGNRHDPRRGARRRAAQGQFVIGALGDERLRDRFRRGQEVVARAAFKEAHARHRGKVGTERLRHRARLEDDLSAVRVCNDATRFGDARHAHVLDS